MVEVIGNVTEFPKIMHSDARCRHTMKVTCETGNQGNPIPFVQRGDEVCLTE